MKIFEKTLGEYVRFNIFTAPELSPPGDEGRGAFHVFGHVAFGTGIGSLISWAISSLVMWITRLATRRSASATP